MALTIEELVELSRKDRAYTNRLWKELQPLCTSWIHKLHVRGEEEEDFYQESYLILLKALELYEAQTDIYFETYYKLLLYRWGRNYKRKRTPFLIQDKEEEDFWGTLMDTCRGIEEEILYQDQLDRLAEGLRSLPELEYRLIVDFYIRDYKLKDLISVYGLDYKALESRKRRTLKKLKKFFDAFEG